MIQLERVIVGTKEIVEYKGKCPDCGKTQKNFSEAYVDVPCWDCSKKRKEITIKNEYKYLIGGTVIDVYGYDDLTCLRIKASNGKEYDITSHREFGEDVHLDVDEVKHE